MGALTIATARISRFDVVAAVRGLTDPAQTRRLRHRATGGAAIAVSDDEIDHAWRDAGRQDGLLLCPEGAATLAGLRRAVASGAVSPGERVALFNCATAYKYPLPA